jgi:hypothetical protein
VAWTAISSLIRFVPFALMLEMFAMNTLTPLLKQALIKEKPEFFVFSV